MNGWKFLLKQKNLGFVSTCTVHVSTCTVHVHAHVSYVSGTIILPTCTITMLLYAVDLVIQLIT